jgi:hypothetical protein
LKKIKIYFKIIKIISKIQMSVKTRSNSGHKGSRSIGTQTSRVGIYGDGDSNYDTLNTNPNGLKSAPFSSTPTISSTGRILRKSANSISHSTNDSSIEIPKEHMPNVTDIRKSHLHGKSSLSNISENNSKSKSHVNTRLASMSNQDSQDRQTVSSNSKNSRTKLIRFYIDDNQDEEEENRSDQIIQPSQSTAGPAVSMGERLNETDMSMPVRNEKEAIVSKRKLLSLSVDAKKNKSPRMPTRAKTRSLNGSAEITLNTQDHDIMQVSMHPTTSANVAAEEAAAASRNKSKGKRGKSSSLVVTHLNEIPHSSQPDAHDHRTQEGYHYFDNQDQAVNQHRSNESQEETFHIATVNMDEISILIEDQVSIQHMDSGLVQPRVQPAKRKSVKRPASERAQGKIENIRQSIGEFEVYIRELSEFDHERSNVRRSERLRLKRLRRLMIARANLINQLRNEENAREEYERKNAAKKAKKSQPLKVNTKFVTLRRNNEGYSGQKRKVKAQRKSKQNC